MRSRISLVIPTLNEAEFIESALSSVERQEGPFDIIVADGGSGDDTCRIAQNRALVVPAERGRARQMNAGARHARGEVLLFLHADTRLPGGALGYVRDALADPGCSGGAFRLRFDVASPLLRFYAFCTRFPVASLCFGDRALFVRREVFEAVGGFPVVPIFEDLEMVRSINSRGTFTFLDRAVTTSARRFVENGPFRQQMRNAFLWTRYVLGTDPTRLERHYPYETAGLDARIITTRREPQPERTHATSSDASRK